jgi:hypothetical protein
MRSVNELVAEIRASLAAQGAAGRFGTWPVPASMMWTVAGTEYAIKYLNGEAPQGREIDYDLLSQLMSEYMFDLTGDNLTVELNPFSLQGRSWQNYVLGIIGTIVF